MHNHTILTKPEEYLFKKIMGKEKRKYLFLSFAWNLMMWGFDYLVFVIIPFIMPQSLIIYGVMGLFTFLGIILIIETIKKFAYWKLETFGFSRGKILERRMQKSAIRHQLPHYYITVELENGRIIRDMHVWEDIYDMSQTDVVFAKSYDEMYQYVFNPDAQAWAEIHRKHDTSGGAIYN